MFQRKLNLFDCICDGIANILINLNRSEMESTHSPLGRIAYLRASPCSIGYKYTEHGLSEYIESTKTKNEGCTVAVSLTTIRILCWEIRKKSIYAKTV